MNSTRVWEELRAMENTPEPGTEEHQIWLSHKDSVSFLMDTTNVPFPLYIAAGSFFAYSVLIPEAGLSGDYIDDL